MDVLLIATNNPGKLREMQALFADYPGRPLRLVTPADLDLDLDVTEDGQTYAENAIKKAQAFSAARLVLALADDSGLEVDALDGRPGLYSARFTGSHAASDAERRSALLQELRGQPQPWTARFCCAAALALPDGSVYTSQGVCEGEIIPQERGSQGFGYDPIFRVADPTFDGRTMAELSLPEKNRISHRARAVHGAFPILQKLLK